jgi:hypothetical protein
MYSLNAVSSLPIDLGYWLSQCQQLCKRLYTCAICPQHPFVNGYDGTDELERLTQTFTSLEIDTQEEEDEADEVRLVSY